MDLKNGKIFTSKFVGTGPSSYEKRIYWAAVSQRLRNRIKKREEIIQFTFFSVSHLSTTVVLMKNYTELDVRFSRL